MREIQISGIGSLLRLTSLTNGGLQYHLKILERSHKVKVDRHDGRRTRYYPLDIPTSESHILGCVRNNVARQIVFFILEHDLRMFGEVVEHTKKAQSTVSWHLKRLSEAGIISISYGPEYQSSQDCEQQSCENGIVQV